MSKEIIVINQQEIEKRIFYVRGNYVVLDKDIAAFYEVKPIRLREQVKRNINRFPEDFMFQLTEEEVGTMVSQNAIPSKQSLGGYLPVVFTEQGVAAVSAVLKSEKAAQVSMHIPDQTDPLFRAKLTPLILDVNSTMERTNAKLFSFS